MYRQFKLSEALRAFYYRANSGKLIPRVAATCETLYLYTRQRNYVFYLDARNLLDVIDYWNLRALGFNILAIPRQAASQPRLLDIMKTFIADNHSVSRHDSSVHFNVHILRARSISKQDFQEFISTTQVIADLQQTETRPLIQDWFPRFWEQWSREHNNCSCIRFFADLSESEVVADDQTIRFRPLIPEFANELGGRVNVANELSFRTYSDGEPIAQVFPSGDEKLGAAFGTFPIFRDWRFSSTGPVHFPQIRHFASFGVPQAQRVVEQWFACDGWKVSASQAGLATRELLKHLGGAYLVSRIADEDLVALLNELGKGRPITHKSLLSRAWQIAKRRGVESPHGIIGTLMTSRLVSLRHAKMGLA